MGISSICDKSLGCCHNSFGGGGGGGGCGWTFVSSVMMREKPLVVNTTDFEMDGENVYEYQILA